VAASSELTLFRSVQAQAGSKQPTPLPLYFRLSSANGTRLPAAHAAGIFNS
jgi:hypothetical protein